MNFVNLLLRAIGFIPSLVTGIEGMCMSKSSAEKKDAAMSFLENAIAMSDDIAPREIVQPEQFKNVNLSNRGRSGSLHEFVSLGEERGEADH